MIFNTHILFCLIIFLKIGNCYTKKSPSFVLTCGNLSPSKDADGRKWTPDENYLIAPHNATSAAAQSQDPSLPSSIPYMTARIFPSQSTYTFSISPQNRHWLRFHFYPSSYSDFKPSESYFSVKAGNFTLLNNFSALITSQALTQSYIIKEFSLMHIRTGSLDVTFTPNANSVAFVNGIEVIPIPEIFETANLVGFPDQALDTKNSVMESMFRLNVGGKNIPASNDSGLGRVWYDDTPYVYGAAIGVTNMVGNNVPITYLSNLGKSVAPSDVYRTARTMGPNAKVNEDYNLTWVFQVDLNFTYVVRLHFCEFEFSKTNQRVFDIFINNQTAQKEADVLAWAGSRQGVPIYKDYAIHIGDKSGEQELWIALHPSVSVKPEYYDAILNGLEVFKVNDSNWNLAGPNPVLSSLKEKAEKSESLRATRGKNHDLAIVGGVVGGTGGLVLVTGVIIFFSYRKVKLDEKHGFSANSTGNWLPLHSSPRSSSRTLSSKSSGNSRIFTLSEGLYRHFTLSEMRDATNNFDESEVIGVGGFGKVYKGVLGKGTKVAMKRSNLLSEQGVHEFRTEIDLLSKLRHRHLVSLIGACEEEDEMILVYDYMANGTLRDHLCKNNYKPHLSWRKRLEICIGAARGIHYLHTGAKQTIIHRDVKTTNILLDENFVAKVSDFGLSKTGINVDNTHVSTMVKGSFGYLDPEYFRRQQLTEKSDVYSFGVVLFEVLCGRAALDNTLPKDQANLADWVIKNHQMGTLNNLIDDNISGDINSECLNKFVGIAIKCLSDNGAERPTMESVLWNLEYLVQLHDNPNCPKIVAEQKTNDAYIIDTTVLSVDEVKEETQESSSATFSMLVNLPGR